MALSKLFNENYYEKLRDLRECCSNAEKRSILPSYIISNVRECDSNLCRVIRNSRSFAYKTLQILEECEEYLSATNKYESESKRLVKEAANLGSEARNIAGFFHDTYVQIESRKLHQQTIAAVENASRSCDSAQYSYEKADKEARDKKETAKKWRTAAMITAVASPLLTVAVTIPGAIISGSSARDARNDAERALVRFRSAEQDLESAQKNKECAEVKLYTYVRTYLPFNHIHSYVLRTYLL